MTVDQCGLVKPDGSNRITIDGHSLLMEDNLVTMIFEPVKVASFTLENSYEDTPSVEESASEETQKVPATHEEVQASSKSAVSWIN